MGDSDLFKQARALRKDGRAAEALQLLRDALQRGRFDASEVDRAGAFDLKLAQDESHNAAQRIRVLGQCTTTWLVNCIAARGLEDGAVVRVSEGEYDNVFQEIVSDETAELKPDTFVLVPWSSRLLGSSARSAEQRIDDEVAFWSKAWSTIAERYGSRIIQVGYDWVSPGALGYHLGGRPSGTMGLIRRVNERLREAIGQDSYFVDLDSISGEMGRRHFYDTRRYYWTKQPFSEAGTAELSRHVWAGVRALTTGPRKVLVLDLDNTLWGGVVGETGPLGVTLGETPDGEAFRDVQKLAKQLKAAGTVLVVASKNNPADAREPFEKNPEMVLGIDDIALFEASWEAKGEAVRRAAQVLNLGTDSFVFFDDNPAEREHMRHAVPEVSVVELPEDPALFASSLIGTLWFERAAVTEADAKRTDQYLVESKRLEASESFDSTEAYLRSLEMIGDIRAVSEADMSRVVQLIGKTNQFNLTTRRHTRDDVAKMSALPNSVCLSLRLGDRFGDYGLISVLLCVPDRHEHQVVLRIDTWLMSCRAIGRTVEDFFLAELVRRAKALGYGAILGEYRPSPKNDLVRGLLERMGFTLLARAEDGASTYLLQLGGISAPSSFVQTTPA
jgi:FkbH-like protein